MTADEPAARCDHCGFDASEWTGQDLKRTLANAEALTSLWSAGAGADLMLTISALVSKTRESVKHPDNLAATTHGLWHTLVNIDALRREHGDQVRSQQGAVAQLNRSSGGVPKTAVALAEVDRRGLLGDVQATRVHHGRPWQALCLWSAEVIAELAAEGHPVFAGATGENVTISGIDWPSLRAGTILDIGSVRAQLSAPATPCSKNRRWFLNGAIDRMDHDRNPGRSRWYATVLRGGTISTGEPVVVEPARPHGQGVTAVA